MNVKAVKVRFVAFVAVSVVAAGCGADMPGDLDGSCGSDELGASRCMGDKTEVCQVRSGSATPTWVIAQICNNWGEACYPGDKCDNGVACCK